VAYASISFIGICNTLKMLPIAVFMVFYKSIWLIVIAYPLWVSNTLKSSEPEELANIFIWALIAIPFIHWKYFFSNFILPTKK